MLAHGADNYVYDLEKDTSTKVFMGGSQYFNWAPDSRHVAFSSDGGLSWMRGDGAGDPQILLHGPSFPRPASFAPDGSCLAYNERSPGNGFDIWTLPLDLKDPDHPRPGAPELFLRTSAEELVPEFSPDGRWISYRSNESGTTRSTFAPSPPTALANGRFRLEGAYTPSGRKAATSCSMRPSITGSW
jgi:WD40-like Beta Propeller Repeat